MTASVLIDAFQIPDDARVDQRVPKKLLTEQGAPTAADKRAIQDGIEEILWVAALKPTNIGVPEFRDETREYVEIAILEASLRAEAKVSRLIELFHRAIPYPLVLLVTHGIGCEVSLAHKRWSQGETGKTVVEAIIASPPLLTGSLSDTDQQFLIALPLARQSAQLPASMILSLISSLDQERRDMQSIQQTRVIRGIAALFSFSCLSLLEIPISRLWQILRRND